MESPNKKTTGEITGLGEIEVNKKVVKRIEADWNILPKGPLPAHPFTIKVEAGGSFPLQPYVFVKFMVGLQAPIDLNKIDLDDAYAEATDIVMAKTAELCERVRKGVVAYTTPDKPSASEDDVSWESFDEK